MLKPTVHKKYLWQLNIIYNPGLEKNWSKRHECDKLFKLEYVLHSINVKLSIFDNYIAVIKRDYHCSKK